MRQWKKEKRNIIGQKDGKKVGKVLVDKNSVHAVSRVSEKMVSGV